MAHPTPSARSARNSSVPASDLKAYMIGGGIGSLAAAAFLVRDGGVPGRNITVFESLQSLGGSLDAAETSQGGYSMRGGRMLTTDNSATISKINV